MAAVMVRMHTAAKKWLLINFRMHTAIIKIYIIAAISWPPPLISQLFSPRQGQI